MVLNESVLMESSRTVKAFTVKVSVSAAYISPLSGLKFKPISDSELLQDTAIKPINKKEYKVKPNGLFKRKRLVAGRQD